MTATVRQLDAMPPCVGDEAIPGDRCQVRPRFFVFAVDQVNEAPGLVYAAACVLHVEKLEDWLSLSPWGCYRAPYEAQVYRDVRADAESGEQPAFEITRRAEAG